MSQFRVSGKRVAMLVLLLIGLFAGATAAQDDACPAMQDRAQALILESCAEQEAGSLCFGHPTVTPVLREGGARSGRLRQPGDSLPIADIDWLSVSSEARTWGAARALFPAYPPDGLEPRTAALVAVGNVALFFPEPVEQPAVLLEIQVTAPRGAYLRAEPSLEAEIVTPLAVRTKLWATSVSPGPTWLRVYYAPDKVGWISQAVVTEPAAELPLAESDGATTPLWLPWQEFDFRSGIDDMACEGTLESGILLGTPKFIAPRRFHINGVEIDLSGAAWLQAQVGSGMLIHVIDGVATVRSAGREVSVNRGLQTVVPLQMNENGVIVPGDVPVPPAAYDYHALINLPIHLMIYETRVSIDPYSVLSPVPVGGGSPIAQLSADDDCMITAHLHGANIRARPEPEAPIIAVMAYRESANPVERGIGTDRLPWWKLGNSIWIRVDATVSGGDCNAVPLILPDN